MKLKVYACLCILLGSRPSRARGLKLSLVIELNYINGVALFAGAWVETAIRKIGQIIGTNHIYCIDGMKKQPRFFKVLLGVVNMVFVKALLA